MIRLVPWTESGAGLEKTRVYVGEELGRGLKEARIEQTNQIEREAHSTLPAVLFGSLAV